MTRSLFLNTRVLSSLLLVGAFSALTQASAYTNPALNINIKQVDPAGKLEVLKTMPVFNWVMKPTLCYEFKFATPFISAPLSQWKIVEERGATGSLKDDGISVCIREKLASFSVVLKANPLMKEHYLFEVNSDPSLSLTPACVVSDAHANLNGDFLGVGLECKLTPTMIYFRAHFGANKSPLVIKYQNKVYAENKPFGLPATVATPLIFPIFDAKGHAYGSVQLDLPVPKTPLPTPTPSPTPKPIPTASPSPTPKPVVIDPYLVPAEILAGATLQTRTATFFPGSLDNQNLSDKLLQFRLFRRALLPFPFKPKFLRDLHYTAQARTDFGSTDNVDLNFGILKPISLFTNVRTLIGVSEEYATTLNSNFGVTRFLAPSLDLQIERVGGTLGTRLRFAYANTASIKYDAQVFYLPPWRATYGMILSADYGYVTFPSSSTVQYSFKETRIGFQIGYRFGAIH